MMQDANQLDLPTMFSRCVQGPELDALIAAAHREDLGQAGDITSRIFISESARGQAVFHARTEGRLSGAALLERIARVYDPALRVTELLPDGSPLGSGQPIAAVSGSKRSILAAERVMLNFMTHLSGIATMTARFVGEIAGTRARILDTRKTIPGLRSLAKYAVRCGGGLSHRMGLHDAVLIKDNHLAGVPVDSLRSRLDEAIAASRKPIPPPLFVEVEVDTLKQLQIVLECAVDFVLLDNMPPEVLKQAVAMRDRIAPRVLLEASGGVNLQTVRAIAESGVDRISIGALTHSAPALDIGLDMDSCS